MSRKAPTPPPYKPGDTVVRPAPPPCPSAPGRSTGLHHSQKRKLKSLIQIAIASAVRADQAGSLPTEERDDVYTEETRALNSLIEYVEGL